MCRGIWNLDTINGFEISIIYSGYVLPRSSHEDNLFHIMRDPKYLGGILKYRVQYHTAPSAVVSYSALR
jgi:hypothetical protein